MMKEHLVHQDLSGGLIPENRAPNDLGTITDWMIILVSESIEAQDKKIIDSVVMKMIILDGRCVPSNPGWKVVSKCKELDHRRDGIKTNQ